MDIKKTPTVIVVFGATGDLMKKKLAPAFFHLFENQRLPELFSVVGFSLPDISDGDFQQQISHSLDAHLGTRPKTPEAGQNWRTRPKAPDARLTKPEVRERMCDYVTEPRARKTQQTGFSAAHLGTAGQSPEQFLDLFTYQQGLFENPADYGRLSEKLAAIDDQWKVCANKLFYLAVPPEQYENIFRQLAASGLSESCGGQAGWTRILVEKPFGKNLAEAKKLDLLLGELFKDEQVYRIDHYLGKEVPQNMVLFRFANNLLEDVWNNKYIERIDVKLLEDIGVERRGAFYDGVGTLLDVGQNHLLQMLALVTMESPGGISPQAIRERRQEILDSLEPVEGERIRNQTVRGQYEGYRQEDGVAADSTTETYFKIKTRIDSPRWLGVPIFLESGKKLPEVQKEVVVTFRHPRPCLCPPGKHFKNSVHFRLAPAPGITIKFWSKKPGEKVGLEEQSLDFNYKDISHSDLEEYTRLLLDCMAGDQTLFISGAETMAGWRFIDPIVTGWQADTVPLHIYPPDDTIYKAAETLEEAAVGELPQKDIGLIGLGKMGGNLARLLMERDWLVTGFNKLPEATQALEAEGLTGAYSLEELVSRLKPPRIIWVMVPAGAPVDEVIFGSGGLIDLIDPGDIIIDGGNSFHRDTQRRAAELAKRGIKFMDVGVSGGPGGARNGSCLMVGGDREVYDYLLPLFLDLSVPEGLSFFPGAGAGHFVKMVHNGIEYGMMQAIAEGFAVLKESDYKIDLTGAAHVYDHGSVIESRLIGWLENALKLYGPDLEGISGVVEHTGEAEWTVAAGKELGVEEKIIAASLEFRVETSDKPSYTGQILTALRNQFGGHSKGK